MELSGNLIKGTGNYVINEIAPPSEAGDILSGWDFTDGWTAVNSTISSPTTFTSSLPNRGVRKLGYTTLGKTYRAYIEGESTSNNIQVVNNAAATSYSGSISASGAFSHSFIFVASTDTGIYVANIDTGTTTVTILTIEEVPEGYPLMEKGDKYLQCTSSGSLAIPSDQAYGEWEWSFYKNADANNMNIQLFNTEQYISAGTGLGDGYRVDALSNSEAINLRRIDDGSPTTLYTGTTSAFNIGTWYGIKVTRTLAGVFNIYTKSQDDLTWTFLGTATDNTNKVAQYFSMDIDLGDRIANLVMRPAVRQ